MLQTILKCEKSGKIFVIITQVSTNRHKNSLKTTLKVPKVLTIFPNPPSKISSFPDNLYTSENVKKRVVLGISYILLQ